MNLLVFHIFISDESSFYIYQNEDEANNVPTYWETYLFDTISHYWSRSPRGNRNKDLQ